MTDYNNKTENIVDVEYDNVVNVIYLSAPQLAKKIGTTEATVRTWADVYGDLIGIEKINGRKTYKETQVSCFAFIKDLVDNKNMNKTQVRNYISKHGFKYAEYNSGLVDPKDPLGFEALSSSLTIKVQEELNEFKKDVITEVINQVDNRLKNYMMLQGEAISEVFDKAVLRIDEVVSEKLEENSKEISTKLNENSKELKQHIDESTEKSTQMQQENKKLLEEVAVTMNDMKETNDKLKELLEDPEATKKIKKENDSWISKLAKKFK